MKVISQHASIIYLGSYSLPTISFTKKEPLRATVPFLMMKLLHPQGLLDGGNVGPADRDLTAVL